jgi:hypothetical protein
MRWTLWHPTGVELGIQVGWWTESSHSCWQRWMAFRRPHTYLWLVPQIGLTLLTQHCLDLAGEICQQQWFSAHWHQAPCSCVFANLATLKQDCHNISGGFCSSFQCCSCTMCHSIWKWCQVKNFTCVEKPVLQAIIISRKLQQLIPLSNFLAYFMA